jgi:hypothetical protein
MKRLLIAIGTNEINKSKFNIFLDEEDLGIDYYNQRGGGWKYYEVELEDQDYAIIDKRIKDAFCSFSGFDISGLFNIIQNLQEGLQEYENKEG